MPRVSLVFGTIAPRQPLNRKGPLGSATDLLQIYFRCGALSRDCGSRHMPARHAAARRVTPPASPVPPAVAQVQPLHASVRRRSTRHLGRLEKR